MPAIVFAVYALGILTILSFLTFAFLLFRYRKLPPPPDIQSAPAAGRDELHAFDPQKMLENMAKIIDATTALTKALKDAKPVVLTAVLTILFLLCWLFSLTLLVISRLPGAT